MRVYLRVCMRVSDCVCIVDEAFRLVVRSSFAFASSTCVWVKLMASLILTNHSYRLQKQMKNELQVEMPYSSRERVRYTGSASSS